MSQCKETEDTELVAGTERGKSNHTMISAVTWVPRGMARANPIRFEPTEEELDYARAQASLDNLELHQGGHRDTTTASSDDDQDQEGLDSNDVVLENTDGSELGPEFQMDTYDEEDEGGNAFNSTDMMMDDDHIDPNFTVPMDDLDSDEEEDNMIKPTDAILLAAHAEDDYSCLEVYVYDAKQGSLYVHHDIALPAFPLALAWTGHVPYSSIDGHQQSGGGSGSSSSSSGGGGSNGNFVAVGTFEPGIEIWNLDVLEALTPTAVLGGRESEEEAAQRQQLKNEKKKKKGKKNRNSKKKRPLLPSLRAGSHTDAVLGLSWNQQQRHILASGSADHVVKIWDLSTCQCLASFTHHKDKVQAVQWHPLERTVLATGGYDGTVNVLDVRSP